MLASASDGSQEEHPAVLEEDDVDENGDDGDEEGEDEVHAETK